MLDWCIGEKENMGETLFSRVASKTDEDFKFHSLRETMKMLGHKRVDIFKFDIEGFEWKLIESEILNAPSDRFLPNQLLFELHLEGVTPKFVPPHLVKGKRRNEVNVLMLKLFNRGYRVVNKECNNPSVVCEFALIRKF